MKYWTVAFHVDATGHVLVEAETEEEAKEIAWGEIDNDCVEIGDPIDIVDCTELTSEEYERYRK